MNEQWYYVEEGQRRGPVDYQVLLDFIQQSKLLAHDFVWKKGFSTWQKLQDIPELFNVMPKTEGVAQKEITLSSADLKAIRKQADFSTLNPHERNFFIQTGADRRGVRIQYGPYSLHMLVRLFRENRINGKTHIWMKGMEGWKFLGEMPFYQASFDEPAPPLEKEKKNILPPPFVARIFWSQTGKLYEGICRDISVGGLQFLLADFPGKIGDEITLNIHPENNEQHFSAKGKIVRELEGKSGFSIRFASLSDEARLVIGKYVEIPTEL